MAERVRSVVCPICDRVVPTREGRLFLHVTVGGGDVECEGSLWDLETLKQWAAEDDEDSKRERRRKWLIQVGVLLLIALVLAVFAIFPDVPYKTP